jgi:hypothetical protein
LPCKRKQLGDEIIRDEGGFSFSFKRHIPDESWLNEVTVQLARDSSEAEGAAYAPVAARTKKRSEMADCITRIPKDSICKRKWARFSWFDRDRELFESEGKKGRKN